MYNIHNRKDKIFEIDVVKIKDNYVIAHDNTELKFYNSDIKFKDMTFEYYSQLKIFNKYTPMTFDKLNNILDNYPDFRYKRCKFRL